MQRNPLITLLGAMTIAIAGCATEEPPVVTTSPSPVPVPAPTTPPPAKTQPLTTQRPGLPAPVPGLIQPTNPQERSRQVETEIRTNQGNNPFEALPPVIPNPAGGNQPIPTVAQLPGNRPPTTGQPTSPAGNRPGGTAQPANPGGVNSRQPDKQVETPSIPKMQGAPLGVNLPPVATRTGTGTGTQSAPLALPPRPSTNTAEAVEVTGVVVIGRTPQAIVVAPGDATSRYVSPGQRISGGKVLVKRIELGNGSDPVVILEENGVEVSRSVGEKPPRPTNNSAA